MQATQVDAGNFIPDKNEQTVRYYEYYSNKSRGLRKKAETDDGGLNLIPADTGNKALRRSRARLIRKVYEVDPLICPKCSGEMRIIGFIDQETVVRKILARPGLWETRNHGPPSAVKQNVVYDDGCSRITKYDDWIQ